LGGNRSRWRPSLVEEHRDAGSVDGELPEADLIATSQAEATLTKISLAGSSIAVRAAEEGRCRPRRTRGTRAYRAGPSRILSEIRERLVEVLGHVDPASCAAEMARAVLGRPHRHQAHGTVARHDHDRTLRRLVDQVGELRESLCDRYRSHAQRLTRTAPGAHGPAALSGCQASTAA
jgi:hypothetical protein